MGKAINAGDTTNKVWCKCNVCNNYAIVDKDELDKLLSKNKNYTYKREVCFNGLKGRRGSLRFDFAIYMGNDVLCLIEFDGEQHDSVNKQLFKIKSKEKAKYDERAKASFERIQEYDGLKNEYCRDNNIPLLRIKYTVKTAEIEGQILNFLASID